MSLKGKVFYGWVIVAISLAVLTASGALYRAWPVFYIAILDHFQWSRAETALIFSVSSIIYSLSSPIVGTLYDRIGPRKLFTLAGILLTIGAVGCYWATEIWQFAIFFGFFIGFGTNAAGFAPHTALVSPWFERKRSTALGIAQTGTRSSFIFTPLIQTAIISLGWQNSFLVMAAIVGVTVISLSQFLKAKPQEMGLLPDGLTEAESASSTKSSSTPDKRIVNKEWAATNWTLIRAMKTYRFWILPLMMVNAAIPIMAFINHTVGIISEFGYSAMFGANLLLVYAVTSMLGRLCGFISDYTGRENAITLSMLFMVLPLPILLITRDTSAPWLLYIFIAAFGLGNGAYGPYYAAAAADIFQGNNFGAIIGFAEVGFGLGAAIGTWLFGYIVDTTTSYTATIYITMVCAVLMSLLIWVAAPRKIRRVAGKVSNS